MQHFILLRLAGRYFGPEHRAKVVPGVLLVVIVGPAVIACLSWSHRVHSSDHMGLVSVESVYDAGNLTIAQARRVEHAFLITNTSEHPIRIIRVATTCGCTSAEVTRDIIPPGGAAQAMLRADWSARAGRTLVRAELSTDDPNGGIIILTLRGFITLPATIAPTSLNFGLMEPGEVRTRIIEITTGTDPRPFHLLGMASTSSNIRVTRIAGHQIEARQVTQIMGGAGKFEVVVQAPQTPGREDGEVTFFTDLTDRATVKLPVRAQYAGAVAVHPAMLLFISGAAAEDASRELRVEWHGSDPEPRAEIIWKGAGSSPLKISHIGPIVSDGLRKSFVLTMIRSNLLPFQGSARAKIRIISPVAAPVEVPVTMMGH